MARKTSSTEGQIPDAVQNFVSNWLIRPSQLVVNHSAISVEHHQVFPRKVPPEAACLQSLDLFDKNEGSRCRDFIEKLFRSQLHSKRLW